jgi:RNA polymerase-binding transcription factor DksA
MRHHFHRCTNLRVLSVDASELSGERHGGGVILDELCEARNLARCVGLAECDVLTDAQKRDLLATRVTRMREEEGGYTALGEVGGERGRTLLDLAREFLDDRQVILDENQRLLVEAAAAEDRRERTASPSEEAELAASGISMRWDEGLGELQVSRLDAIDRALEAMGGRGYGVCVRCSSLIPIERLREAPDTRVCLDCARKSAPVA